MNNSDLMHFGPSNRQETLELRYFQRIQTLRQFIVALKSQIFSISFENHKQQKANKELKLKNEELISENNKLISHIKYLTIELDRAKRRRRSY